MWIRLGIVVLLLAASLAVVSAPSAAEAPAVDGGYWLAAADGGVFSFGDYPFHGSAPGDAETPIVGMVALCAASGVISDGYALVDRNDALRSFSGGSDHEIATGVVFSKEGPTAGAARGCFSSSSTLVITAGSAPPSDAGVPLFPSNYPLVAGDTRADSTSAGWFVAADGGVFSVFARFHGSLGGQKLTAPISDIESTPSGGGYWLVGEDGAVYPFGDAGFFGHMGNIALNAPVVAMRATSTGHGYWLAAADGGVFAYGDARFYGSAATLPLNAAIVDIA